MDLSSSAAAAATSEGVDRYGDGMSSAFESALMLSDEERSKFSVRSQKLVRSHESASEVLHMSTHIDFTAAMLTSAAVADVGA